jgi:hypothetical protein
MGGAKSVMIALKSGVLFLESKNIGTNVTATIFSKKSCRID